MCGIVGIAGTQEVAPIILEALKRLEYRGYDSAGIATLVDGAIEASPFGRASCRSLARNCTSIRSGRTGIGHWCWATYGAPMTIARSIRTRIAAAYSATRHQHRRESAFACGR